MSELRPYSVVAFNTATASTNKIHDDAVARQYGFRGGLVPGVDVYAYLTHPPVEAWGLEWLERGTMRARFLQPVYDGETVEVAVVGERTLELRGGSGRPRASATASFPESMPARPALADWPAVEQRADPPPASPEALVPGTVLGLAPHTFHADRAGEYLADVRDELPIYTEAGIAHPAWILRDANDVLSSNVRLGPWLHVESAVQHHGVVHDGESVSARAVVLDEWERKGHRFVTLDVLHLAEDRPVARTTHTPSHTPRAAS